MTKKDTILNTTLCLIAEQGILATPMSQIQEESGVATGTIYHHFKSKEEIINYLYTREKLFFEKIGQNEIKNENSYHQNFCNIVNAICNYYLENINTFHYFKQVVNSKYITEETREKANIHLALIANFLQEGIDTNQVEKEDVPLLMDLLHSNLDVYVESVLKGKIDDKTSRERLLNYVWKAIKK